MKLELQKHIIVTRSDVWSWAKLVVQLFGVAPLDGHSQMYGLEHKWLCSSSATEMLLWMQFLGRVYKHVAVDAVPLPASTWIFPVWENCCAFWSFQWNVPNIFPFTILRCHKWCSGCSLGAPFSKTGMGAVVPWLLWHVHFLGSRHSIVNSGVHVQTVSSNSIGDAQK